MADAISDVMGGLAGGAAGQIGIVFWGSAIMIFIGVVFLILWRKGIIFNNLKTIALNWEERGANGEMVLIDIDYSGIQKNREGVKYRVKGRNRIINPPPLRMISRSKDGRDLVNLYWADRDEAYAFKPRRFTADYIREQASEAYRKKYGRGPVTLEEFLEGLGLVEAHDAIFFRPAVDESSVNLIMTELQNIESLYSDKFLAMIEKYAPLIGLVLVVLITIVGFMWIRDGLSSMQIVCNVAENAANNAVQNLPGIPELPK